MKNSKNVFGFLSKNKKISKNLFDIIFYITHFSTITYSIILFFNWCIIIIIINNLIK